MTAVKLALRMLAPRGPRSRLSVLIFHRVLRGPDPLRPGEPDTRAFEAQMHWVSRWFNVLPLGDAVQGLSTGDLPERPLAITFDDGYADNCTLALPILRRLGLHATFFIASGFLNGGRMWNDTIIEAIRAHQAPALDLNQLALGKHITATVEDKQRCIGDLLGALKYRGPEERTGLANGIARIVGRSPPEDLMMTSQQVAELHRNGMTIGAHTVSHPILLGVPTIQARSEIVTNKNDLERIIGSPITLFAYPNGIPNRDYGLEHVKMVKELGFDGAVSTAWGASRAGSDVFQIPRFTPWDRPSWKYGLRLLQNLFRDPIERAA